MSVARSRELVHWRVARMSVAELRARIAEIKAERRRLRIDEGRKTERFFGWAIARYEAELIRRGERT